MTTGDVGQDAGFLARVEGVVHRFFDGGEQGLARVVEARRWRFLAKNSETEISFWRVAIDSAVSRLILVFLMGAAVELDINDPASSVEREDELPDGLAAEACSLSTREILLSGVDRCVIGRARVGALALMLGDCMGLRGMGQGHLKAF
jgi:hypothetical protein